MRSLQKRLIEKTIDVLTRNQACEHEYLRKVAIDQKIGQFFQNSPVHNQKSAAGVTLAMGLQSFYLHLETRPSGL